jgi:hypothetical protein
VQRDSDEEAWRAIVENYGERVRLDDDPLVDLAPESRAQSLPESLPDSLPKSAPDPSADSGPESLTEPSSDSTPEPATPQRLEKYFIPLPQPAEPDDELEERFVPPPPPPLPKPPPDRLLAWLGLFGSPAVLLVCLVAGVHLPSWLGYLLVGSFIGGFVYLVVKMPRGEDIDPWDDGARV